MKLCSDTESTEAASKVEATLSRRALLGRALVIAVGAPLLPAGLAACNEPEPPQCTDTKGLAEPEKALRATFAYVDRSPDPAKECKRCQQWKPAPRPDLCGGCKVIKGPFHPRGTCKLFAPTAA